MRHSRLRPARQAPSEDDVIGLAAALPGAGRVVQRPLVQLDQRPVGREQVWLDMAAIIQQLPQD